MARVPNTPKTSISFHQSSRKFLSAKHLGLRCGNIARSLVPLASAFAAAHLKPINGFPSDALVRTAAEHLAILGDGCQIQRTGWTRCQGCFLFPLYRR
jgi:hypothetical protein